MKTYNLLYTKFNQIESYVRKKQLSKAKNLLIQVTTTADDNRFISDIKKRLIQLMPNAEVLGITTSKVLYNGVKMSQGTVISITDFEHTQLVSYACTYDDTSSFTVGQKFAKQLTSKNTQLIIAFMNDPSIDGDRFTKGFNKEAKHVTLCGGFIYHQNGCLFNNDSILPHGIIGIALNSDALTVATYNSYAWSAISKEHRITSSSYNLIEQIDSILAEKIYTNYIGRIQDNDLPYLGIDFPLLVDNEDTLTACPILDYTNDGHLRTFAHLRENEKISFGMIDLKRILEILSNHCEKLRGMKYETLMMFATTGLIPIIQDDPYNTTYDPNYITCCFTSGEFSYRNNKNTLQTGNITIVGLSEGIENEIVSIDNLLSFIPKHEQSVIFSLLDIIKNTGNKLSIISETYKETIHSKNNSLINQYYIDKLTNLPNLHTFNEMYSDSSPILLSLIDISSFININNFYGTTIGDHILVEFASIIKVYNDARNYYTYRIYSDIFAVVSYNTDASQIFIKDMEALHAFINSHCFLNVEHKIFLTTTIATSSYPQAYRHASMAKEYAKNNRVPFIVYSEALKLEDEVENNLVWSGKIRKAIAEDKIIPFFQPIYDNSTGRIYKFEVLMRLMDDNDKVITPYYFLDIAKKTNLYKQLTKIILDKAFAVFKDTDFDFSVNLDVEDITDKDTCDYIYNKLKNSPNSEHVIFEIVESEGISNFSDVVQFVNTIKSYGARFAIDDFGSGFSNFNYLFKLNIDCIKIDGSIIQNIIHDRAAQLVTETIHTFAKKMGISTIAEFVSNKEIYDKIKSLGIDYSQGYYLAKPVDSLNKFM